MKIKIEAIIINETSHIKGNEPELEDGITEYLKSKR